MSQAPQTVRPEVEPQEVVSWLAELLRLLRLEDPSVAGTGALEKKIGADSAEVLREMVKELREKLSTLSSIHLDLDQVFAAVTMQETEQSGSMSVETLVFQSRNEQLIEERKQLKGQAEDLMNDVNRAIHSKKETDFNLGELASKIGESIQNVEGCIRERNALLQIMKSRFPHLEFGGNTKLLKGELLEEYDQLGQRLLESYPQGKNIPNLIAQQKQAVQQEQQAFRRPQGKEYESLDDVLRIPDPQVRQQALMAIRDALVNSAERRKALASELNDVDPDASRLYDQSHNKAWSKDVSENVVGPEPASLREKSEQSQAAATGRLMLYQMDRHIPEQFLAEREKILERIEVNLMTADEKAQEAEKLRREHEQVDQVAVRKAFEKAIENHSIKGLDRIDPYFDPLLEPPTKEEMEELTPHIDAAVRRARRMLDCLSDVKTKDRQLTIAEKLKQIEAMMEPIPRTWWPAEFVLELQAWRKVEREELREAMHNTAEEQARKMAPPDSTLQKLKKGSAAMHELLKEAIAFTSQPIAMASDVTFVNIDQIGDDEHNIWSTEFRGTANWLTATDQAHTDSQALTALSEKGYDWVVSDEGPYARLPKTKRKERIDKALSVTATLAATVRNTVNYTESARDALAEGVPVLGLFSGLVGLSLAIYHLCEERGIKGETQLILDALVRERMADGPEQDPAFEAALRNQTRHSNRLIAEEGVNVTKSGLKVAAGVAEASGVGMPIAWGIKLTGHVIEVGGRITFANIDCSRIQQAKKTLAEARAGNRIAQQQIFEDSAHYAKMYLAMLVQEGNPKAVHYLHVMGLEEADLSRQEICASVLRDALLSRAKQKDDTKESGSRVRANLDAISGVNSRNVQKAIAVFKWEKKKPTDPYRVDHKVKQKVIIASAEWNAAVEDAQKHAGLVKGSEKQVSEAMKKVVAATKGLELGGVLDAESLESAITKAKSNDPGKFRDPKKVATLAAALAQLDQAILQYTPIHTGVVNNEVGSPGVHEPIEAYQFKVRHLVRQLVNRVDLLACDTEFLAEDTAKDLNWKFAKEPELTKSQWEAAWKDACRAAWMTGAKDSGVAKALNDAESALSDYAKKIRAGTQRFADRRDIFEADKKLNSPDVIVGGDKNFHKDLRAKKRKLEDALKILMKQLDAVRTTTPLNGLRDYVDQLRRIAAEWLRDLDVQLYPDEKDWPYKNVTWDKLEAPIWSSVYDPAIKHGLIDDGNNPKIDDKLKKWRKAHEKIESELKASEGIQSKEVCQARIAAYKDLKAVFSAAEKYLAEVQTPGMQKFVLDLIRKIQAQSIEYDETASSISFGIAEGFTAKAFNATCSEAVSFGAVPEEKGKQKDVASAIQAVHDARTKLKRDDVPAKKRMVLHEVLNKLDAVPMYVNKLYTVHEYAVNETMSGYLKEFLDHPEARKLRNACMKGLRAESAAFFSPAKFEFTNDQWQMFKRVAVMCGILDTGYFSMKATGVKDMIAKVQKTHDALQQFVKQKGTDEEEKQALLDDAYDASTEMRELITELKGATDNREFQNYMNMFLEELKDRELRYAMVA